MIKIVGGNSKAGAAGCGRGLQGQRCGQHSDPHTITHREEMAPFLQAEWEIRGCRNVGETHNTNSIPNSYSTPKNNNNTDAGRCSLGA